MPVRRCKQMEAVWLAWAKKFLREVYSDRTKPDYLGESMKARKSLPATGSTEPVVNVFLTAFQTLWGGRMRRPREALACSSEPWVLIQVGLWHRWQKDVCQESDIS